ncbi:MAG: hemerythrin domain-containing protein [Magnetospirillum sp. WYHS-4]
MGEECYSWRDEYRTGNGAIDAQHRELLKLANLLIDAADKGRSRAVLREAFKALFRYTEKHFEEEEAFWQSSGLPTLAEERTGTSLDRRDPRLRPDHRR